MDIAMSEEMLINTAVDSLNSQQQAAYNESLSYVKGDKEYRQLLIEGFAGTGKTYTISKVVRKLLQQYPEGKIALTAPTNKAVRVLKDNFTVESDRVIAITIHKLLGLKLKIDEKGNQLFQVDLFAEKMPIEDFVVIIIDEVSMLADELFHEVYKYDNVKVILMGDPCQIPPVGKVDSIPLQPELREKYNIHCIRLTEIMRQAHDNPIVALSFYFRENISKDIHIKGKFNSQILENGSGTKILQLSDNAEAREFIADIRRLFTGPEFSGDPNYAKVIAWQNDTVDTFNQRIRGMIYGKNIPKLCIGEKLIADNPIIEKKGSRDMGKPVFNTNDEFEVISFEVGVHANHKVYKAVVEYQTLKSKKRRTINILHEDDEPKYRNNLRRMEEKAKALLETDKGKARQQWRFYFEYISLFAQVNYNYAVTAHKAQGSTYQYCLLHVPDIMRNRARFEEEEKIRRTIERNRILYTAITRPKKLLIMGV